MTYSMFDGSGFSGGGVVGGGGGGIFAYTVNCHGPQCEYVARHGY